MPRTGKAWIERLSVYSGGEPLRIRAVPTTDVVFDGLVRFRTAVRVGRRDGCGLVPPREPLGGGLSAHVAAGINQRYPLPIAGGRKRRRDAAKARAHDHHVEIARRHHPRPHPTSNFPLSCRTGGSVGDRKSV